MAGSNSGFDAAAFEAGIRFAMEMAAPVDSDDRATFYFPKQSAAPADSADGVPFDPSDAHTRTGPDPVTVPCAVEFEQAADQDTNLGRIRPNRLIVTLLESDHDLVEGCESVVYAGERYEYRSTDTAALFSVGVRTMRFTRSDA